MGMSLGFSIVLYNASAHELKRQVPPTIITRDYQFRESQDLGSTRNGEGNDAPQRIDEFFRKRTEEARRTLLGRLALLNALTLVGGAALSCYLARRTLQPIERNMEAQSQFVSDASHELRTPLTTLQTSNEVALRNPKLSLADSKELIVQNIEEVAKLQSLTDGLLTLAGPERGQIVRQRVSLQDVAGDAMNRVISLAQDRAITIDDKVKPQVVLANRQTLAQAVVVLLDNAIKYSPKDSTIFLSGGQRTKRAYISVRDQGPGIRPHDQSRIFDRFYRADQSRSTQHVLGHGIGLSLAKKLVEQQGGEIHVTSTVGKGSTFTISFPLA